MLFQKNIIKVVSFLFLFFSFGLWSNPPLSIQIINPQYQETKQKKERNRQRKGKAVVNLVKERKRKGQHLASFPFTLPLRNKKNKQIMTTNFHCNQILTKIIIIIIMRQ